MHSTVTPCHHLECLSYYTDVDADVTQSHPAGQMMDKKRIIHSLLK